MQALTIPFGYSIQATPTEAFGLKTITSWSAASDPENQDKGTMELVVQRENRKPIVSTLNQLRKSGHWFRKKNLQVLQFF